MLLVEGQVPFMKQMVNQCVAPILHRGIVDPGESFGHERLLAHPCDIRKESPLFLSDVSPCIEDSTLARNVLKFLVLVDNDVHRLVNPLPRSVYLSFRRIGLQLALQMLNFTLCLLSFMHEQALLLFC